MTTSVIEASALCRVFASEDGREPVRAVDGVTFAVPPEARLVALIGPDGAGKSTLMQMICGLVGQDSGSLSVLGRTPDPDDEDFVNAVGYMPQTLGLYKDLSVMENMKLFGALRGTKPPEDMTIEAYYASLIALTGLEGFEGRPAGKLSGGMKQKLALAVALVRAPALLLLDEPTVGVDPLSRRELWAVIRRMVGQGGTTCFFSTAYLEEAESADWVLCMSEGRIIGSGTPAELLGRTKGRTYALDLSGFSDAERKSLSRRMMLKVSPAPEKSVFLDAVPPRRRHRPAAQRPQHPRIRRARGRTRASQGRDGDRSRLRRSRTCAAHGGRLCAPHLHDRDRARRRRRLVRSARPRRSGAA